MLIEEARWFRDRLALYETEQLSPMLNLGSQTQHFRGCVQPWIDQYVFGPLASRGVQVVHTDLYPGEGVDLVGDLTDERFLAQLRQYAFRSLFCSNVLEHVPEPQKLATRLVEILPSGAFLFVSCPRVFPYHPDPVDTGFRPQVTELAEMFPYCELVEGEVVDCGMMWQYVLARGRAWWREHRPGPRSLRDCGDLALSSETRSAGPFRHLPSWQQLWRIALWLCRPVSATCVVLRVTATLAAESSSWQGDVQLQVEAIEK